MYLNSPRGPLSSISFCFYNIMLTLIIGKNAANCKS
nr:MAG TPA: hypothetical protein [Caudoviricetes sp.]